MAYEVMLCLMLEMEMTFPAIDIISDIKITKLQIIYRKVVIKIC